MSKRKSTKQDQMPQNELHLARNLEQRTPKSPLAFPRTRTTPTPPIMSTMSSSVISPETDFSYSCVSDLIDISNTETTSISESELIEQRQSVDDPPHSIIISEGSKPTFSSGHASNISSISNLEKETAIMHFNCTVTSDKASSVQLHRLSSEGSLVCVECGMRFSDIKSLQEHIQNKTVWTNSSLLGCRVSVMWAHNQWYQGIVTQYDTVYGRHCVVYDDGEKKWYHMANKTFLVVSDARLNNPRVARNDGIGTDINDNLFCNMNSNSRVKQRQHPSSNDDADHLSEIESKHYIDEPLSKNYVLAQSIVHMCFGNSTQQVGYRTDGHLCITERDRMIAHDTGASLLYGEVLPRGCNKALDADHLDAASCKTLFDLGMGIGKFALQAFVQFPNLDTVVGVELAASRFVLGEKAALKLVAETHGSGSLRYHLLSRVPGERIMVAQTMSDGRERVLEFRKGNLFSATDCHEADIIIAQTNFPTESQIKLCRFLGCLKPGAKILTYLNLMPLWKRAPIMFRQLDVNRSPEDRFATSWSMHRGCHFYLWERLKPGAFFEGRRRQEYSDGFRSDSDAVTCLPFFRCCGAESARIQNSPDYSG